MTPQKTTTAPAPGRPTEFASPTIESGSSVTRAAGGAESGASTAARVGFASLRLPAPPLTGGIRASSSPALTGASSLAYSRLTATRTGIEASIVEPRLVPRGRERVGHRRPLRQLEFEALAPGALPQHREQTELDLHRGQS